VELAKRGMELHALILSSANGNSRARRHTQLCAHCAYCAYCALWSLLNLLLLRAVRQKPRAALSDDCVAALPRRRTDSLCCGTGTACFGGALPPSRGQRSPAAAGAVAPPVWKVAQPVLQAAGKQDSAAISDPLARFVFSFWAQSLSCSFAGVLSREAS